MPQRAISSVPAVYRPRLILLYVFALMREFRWTLASLCGAVLLGGLLYFITPHEVLNGRHPTVFISLYAAWMALLNQPLYNPPQTWYLTILCALYPLVGAVLIGEGIVRLALLMMSKRGWEKEWVKVMASTYRDHIVLCGLGNLGLKILEQLVASNVAVVVLERRRSAKFIVKAKELRVPVLVRDMKEDQALIDAGIEHARAVVIATNDAVANLEVALDSRRMNPNIRVVMRMFDAQIAEKIAGAMDIDVAFSSTTLSAPLIAAMALHCSLPPARILSTCMIAGVPHVTIELKISEDSGWIGRTIGDLESASPCRVLARLIGDDPAQSPPPASTILRAGDTLVVHTPAAQLAALN